MRSSAAGGSPHLFLDARNGWLAAHLGAELEVCPGAVGKGGAGCEGDGEEAGRSRLALRPLPGSGRPLTEESGAFGGLAEPTGLAVGPDGTIYLLDRGSPAGKGEPARPSQVLRYDPCTCRFEPLPCVGGTPEPWERPDSLRRFRDPRGIAVRRAPSSRGGSADLLVADTGNRRVQIFALKGLGLRAVWGPFRVERSEGKLALLPAKPVRTPPEVSGPDGGCEPAPVWPPNTWEPFDLAPAPAGGMWVSDRANGLVHRFDARGTWCGAVEGEGEPGSGDGVRLTSPTHLAVDGRPGSGRLYVVQEGRPYVAVFDGEGRFLERLEHRQAAEETLAFETRPVQTVAVDPEGNLFVSCSAPASYGPARRPAGRSTGSSRRGRRRRSSGTGGGGSEVSLYRPSSEGGSAGSGMACSCRRLPGKAPVVGFDSSGRPLALDGSEIRVLEPATAYETSGSYRSGALDSGLYRCVWHRVVLTARVPPSTRIRLETYTSEVEKNDAEIAALPADRWQRSADHTGVGAMGQGGGEAGTAGEWDALVRSPAGRYLWLRITLQGDGEGTPEVETVRVEYPRRSSLQRLPAVYREDPESSDFLDRWLSIFDGLREEIGGEIGTIARYFDPAAVPAEFLTWLAAWMGLTFDAGLSIARRRRLLAEAHRLYRLRGTVEGIRLHLELATGLTPRILEHHRLRRWAYLAAANGAAAGADGGEGGPRSGPRLGETTELFGPDLVDRLQLDVYSRIGEFQLIDIGDPVTDPFRHLAHAYTVYLPAAALADPDLRARVRRVLALATPAHVEAHLEGVEPRLRVGLQARVGIDTAVGAYPSGGVREGEARLGRESVLGPSRLEAGEPGMSVGKGSRIGSGTRLT